MKVFSRIFVLFFASLLLCALLAGCGKSSGDSPRDPSVNEGFDAGSSSSGINKVETPDKKIIRTADLDAETKDYNAAKEAITALVTSLGGYTESSRESVYSDNEVRRLSATYRIPAEQLDAFLAKAGETVHITSSGVYSEDVTSEYYDAEARLATLKAEKAALDAMLASAATTEELLAIHKRLYDVMEEIDSLTARLNVYKDEVAYSTVNLSLEEVAVLSETESYGSRLGNAFVSGWSAFGRFFANFFVWLVRALPVLLLLGGIGTGVFFFIRHMNKKHAQRQNKD